MNHAIERRVPASSGAEEPPAGSTVPPSPVGHEPSAEAGTVSAQFGLLQPRPRPWWTVPASFGGQALVIALLLWLGAPVFMPKLMPAHQALLRIDLAPPPPVIHHPRPHIHITPPPPKEVARLERTPAPVPPPERPRPEPKPTPQPVVKTPPVPQPVVRPVVTPPVRPTPAPVKMGVFEASAAHATVHNPARTVQTGGFGSPAGLNSRSFGPANVPRLGGFDLPEGPGHGNGRSGARGTPGVVASTGFGNGIATGHPGRPHGAVTGVSFGDGISRGGSGHAAQGNVQSSGFEAQASRPAAHHQAAEVTTPLEVLYKPKPVYTPEARNLHLEGTVLLSAVFPAQGPVRVIRVIRGLGHGLDQSAIQAAQQIRFKPKQKDGQPVDTTATLAIVFQLAY